MQNYKEGGGASQHPASRGSAPMSMTMSLNGPPGYHMHPAVPGCVPRQDPGGGAREGLGGAQAQHDLFMSGAQLSPATKQGVASAGGGAMMQGYRGMYDSAHGHAHPQQLHHPKQQLAPPPHHQQQVQQQQHQQQLHPGMHHNSRGAAAVTGTSSHSQHQLYSQQAQMHHHQQQQQMQPQASNIHGSHHGNQHIAPPMQVNKDAARSSSAVFKSPAASGYPPSPASSQALNGMPGVVHAQYPGYPPMKDPSPVRSEAGVPRMDVSKYGSGVAGQAPAGYRHGSVGEEVGIDAGRHHPGHMSQTMAMQPTPPHHPSQTQHHPSQAQHMIQHKAQNPYANLQTSTGHHSMGGSSHGHQKSASQMHSPQMPAMAQHPQAAVQSVGGRSSAAARGVPAGSYGPASPQIPSSHLPASHSAPGLHPMLSPGSKDSRYAQHVQQQAPQHPTHPQHRHSTPSPSSDYHRWSATAASSVPRAAGSEMNKHMPPADPHAGSSMRPQPPAGSIRTGEPRVHQMGEGSGHSASSRSCNPPSMSNRSAGLAPTNIAKGSIQLGTPAVRADSKQDSGSKASGGSGVPLDLSRPEPGRPGDSPLDLSCKPRKRSAGEVSPALLAERGELVHSGIKRPRHELGSPKVNADMYRGQYTTADKANHEWQSHYRHLQQTKSSGLAGLPKDDSAAIPGMQPTTNLHGYPLHHSSIPTMPSNVPYMVPGQSSQMPSMSPKGLPTERSHCRSSSSSSTSSQPHTHSIEMSFEGKVEESGHAALAKMVKGVSAPVGSQSQRVPHMKTARSDPMSTKHSQSHAQQPGVHPHRDPFTDRVGMTEEQVHKAMQQQQLHFQRHQQHAQAKAASTTRSYPHGAGGSGVSRAGYAEQHGEYHSMQQNMTSQQAMTSQQQASQHYSQQKYPAQHPAQLPQHHQQQLQHQQPKQQPNQQQQRSQMSLPQQEQQQTHIQQQQQQQQLQRFYQQRQKQEQLHQQMISDHQAKAQYAAYSEAHLQYAAETKRGQSGHYSQAQHQQDAVKSKAMTSGSELVPREGSLSASWPAQRPSMQSRPPVSRAASHDTLESVSDKAREHAPVVAAEQRQSALEVSQRVPHPGFSTITEDMKSAPAAFSPRTSSSSSQSPGQFAPDGLHVMSSRSTPVACLKSSDASGPGGRSRDQSPLLKPAPSPCSADPRTKAEASGFGSRPPSAACSERSGPGSAAPVLDDIIVLGSSPPTSEAAFQRPQPLITGGKAAAKSKDSGALQEGPGSDVEIVSQEECGDSAPSCSEEFLTPLSITIPSSPSVGPATAPRPASPAPPPPPLAGGNKIWSRKRMILNAVNQDESLKKYIGGAGESPQGVRPEYQRLRHLSSSPPPSSPNMPILSPQQKGDSEVASGPSEDPPQLDPSAPIQKNASQKHGSLVRSAGAAHSAGSGSAGSALTSSPLALPPGSSDKAPTAADVCSKVTSGVNGQKGASVMTASTNNSPEAAEVLSEQSESGVPRRCSASNTEVSSVQGPMLPRQENPYRRMSVESRPWTQKNIPVANVAPFIHSKGAGEGAGREAMDPPPHTSPEGPDPRSDQPKPEEKKSEPGDDKVLVATVSETKRNKHNRLARAEKKKKLSGKSKLLSSKSSGNVLERIKGTKSKARKLLRMTEQLERESLPMTAFKMSAASTKDSVTAMDDELAELASRLKRKKEKGAGDKALKQKRSKHAAVDKVKAGAGVPPVIEGEVQDGAETEAGSQQGAADKAAKAKAKKEDLVLSREERAKRRALLRGKEEEREKKRNRMNKKRSRNRTQRRRLSSTNQKARELKRTALGRRPRREATKRKGGQYNRNAAYEEEIRRDESRKAIRRARRHASNLARQRLQQQHRQGGQDEDEDEASQDEHLPVGDEPWDISSVTGHGSRQRKSRAARQPKRDDSGSSSCVRVKASSLVLMSDPEDYFDDADDESKDLSEEEEGERGERGAGADVGGSSGIKSKALVRRKRHDAIKFGSLRRAQPLLGREGQKEEKCEDEGGSAEDSLDPFSHDQVLYPDGDDSCDVTSAIPVPPEVKRIAVNKNSGETLLHRAARLGNEEVTLYCLRSGEYVVNARDNAGYTALHESCVKGSVRVARHLISRGADVNCCSQDGIRPLHDAVENDQAEVARLLLSCGADPLIATYGGRTPLKICRSQLMYDMVKGYLGDLNGYESEEERTWHMPGSYTLHEATGNPDNGFDVFADAPTDDDDDDDVNLDDMFDDGVTAPLPTYELPSPSPDSCGQTVVLQEDLLKQLRLSHKHFSSLLPCARSLLHVTGLQLQQMLDRCSQRRPAHQWLADSEKVAVLPLSCLRRAETSLEQLARRAAFKNMSASSSSLSSMVDSHSDGDSAFIRHLSLLSLQPKEEITDLPKSRVKMELGVGCSGALRVLGEKMSAMSMSLWDCKSGVFAVKTEKTQGVDVKCLAVVKSEKCLIAPSLLQTGISSGTFKGSAPSAFSQSWSKKLPVSHSLSEPLSALSTSLSKASLVKSRSDPPGVSLQDRKPFSTLEPTHTAASQPVTSPQGVAALQSFSDTTCTSFSSTSSNPFAALTTFTNKFPCMSFRSAALQTSKVGQNEQRHSPVVSASSSSSSSPSVSCSNGRAIPSQVRSSHCQVSKGTSTTTPGSAEFGTASGKVITGGTRAGQLGAVSTDRTPPARLDAITDSSYTSFRGQGQGGDLPIGGHGSRQARRSCGTITSSSVPPYGKNIPPGLNPSVVIKTTGNALGTAGSVIKSSSQAPVPAPHPGQRVHGHPPHSNQGNNNYSNSTYTSQSHSGSYGNNFSSRGSGSQSGHGGSHPSGRSAGSYGSNHSSSGNPSGHRNPSSHSNPSNLGNHSNPSNHGNHSTYGTNVAGHVNNPRVMSSNGQQQGHTYHQWKQDRKPDASQRHNRWPTSSASNVAASSQSMTSASPSSKDGASPRWGHQMQSVPAQPSFVDLTESEPCGNQASAWPQQPRQDFSKSVSTSASYAPQQALPVANSASSRHHYQPNSPASHHSVPASTPRSTPHTSVSTQRPSVQPVSTHRPSPQTSGSASRHTAQSVSSLGPSPPSSKSVHGSYSPAQKTSSASHAQFPASRHHGYHSAAQQPASSSSQHPQNRAVKSSGQEKSGAPQWMNRSSSSSASQYTPVSSHNYPLSSNSCSRTKGNTSFSSNSCSVTMANTIFSSNNSNVGMADTRFSSNSSNMTMSNTSFPSNSSSISMSNTGYSSKNSGMKMTNTSFPPNSSMSKPSFQATSSSVTMANRSFPQNSSNMAMTNTSCIPQNSSNMAMGNTSFSPNTSSMTMAKTNFPSNSSTMTMPKTSFSSNSCSVTMTKTSYSQSPLSSSSKKSSSSSLSSISSNTSVKARRDVSGTTSSSLAGPVEARDRAGTAATPKRAEGTKANDFDQMFSDESSSSSFTTVVDNLDYDSSRSPDTASSFASGAATTTLSGHGGRGDQSLRGNTAGKSFGMGLFGSAVASKDRNDNDIVPKS